MNFFSDRYRDWGEFRLEHLVILIGLFFLLFPLYSLIRRARLNSHIRARESIYHPTEFWAGNNGEAEAFGLKKRLFVQLLKEIVREKNLREQLVPEDAGHGDLGWKGNVNFKTSIEKSPLVVDQTISILRPGLHLRNYRSVREYMLALQEEIPVLSTQLRDKYLEFYEKARFAEHEFTESEYQEFMHVVLEIVKSAQ